MADVVQTSNRPLCVAEGDEAQITDLLQAWQRGENAAVRDLLAQVYQRLHRLAERALRGERPDHTLRATALIHEAFLRLSAQRTPDWRDRGHFFALVARMMRRILVDYARAQHAARRGGGQVHLHGLDEEVGQIAAPQSDPIDLIALDRALDALARHDARKARVVELRCFLDLSVSETAELLDVSEPTVILDLRLARAWLSARLGSVDD